ncbi:MAG: DegV family EDD domain-containing protein [Gammaproteobacteria bacterium]|nr:DegV family EDD domain-containing protein [Gammaproteobacteria bacterium]NNC97450.1 DegV family EDD domain-containing protein [Gammaproteobacteria bacterium]NNM12977.1 DegV family EDD domain-containing protein [Gammaproteobacteria bacterium]
MTTAVDTIRYVDGIRLNRALRAGIRRVITKQDYLNKINVFPVPDGDTGTNMVFTLNSVRQLLMRSVDRHAGNTLTRIADAAIDGARGNSGAILAQFFQGLSDAAAGLGKLDLVDFSKAVSMGADYARTAMSEPKEGTILTVLSDFAAAIQHGVEELKHPDFAALLQYGVEQAHISLAATPEKLAILKKSGVVDAGAQGFVELIEGVSDFIRTGSVQDLDQPLDIGFDDTDEVLENYDHGELKFRFCTECLIKSRTEDEKINHKSLREQLNEIGNSVVVAGSVRKTKVHIHVNDPDQVFTIAESFGEVSGQKADDMQQQAHLTHDSDQQVIIVTDSAADIPEELIDELNIYVVPVRINFGNHSYLDKVSLSPKEFYAELVSNPEHPKTSQPSPGDFRRQFEYLASHFSTVIYISVTSGVSGTLQSAQTAAERVMSDNMVHAVDGKNLAVGQGLIVMQAARLAKAGASAETVLEHIEKCVDATKVYAYLGDVDFAVKGGRVSRSKKVLVDLFRLNPILTASPEGKLTSAGMFLGHSNRVKKFVRFLMKKIDQKKTYRILVSHANSEEEGVELMALLKSKVKNLESIDLTDTGTAVGAHGGPGTVVAAIQDVAALV